MVKLELNTTYLTRYHHIYTTKILTRRSYSRRMDL